MTELITLIILMTILFIMCYPWHDDSELSEAELFWRYGDKYDW